MLYATRQTAADMQGFKLAYTQSDEATFLLTDFETHDTQGWFDYELNKVVSISASLFTAYFNDTYEGPWVPGHTLATFDSRAFIVPTDDAPNVFIWRQRDWERNSVQMLARAHFSHNQLHEKGHAEIHEMLHGVGVNWADLPERLKNGTFVLRDGTMASEKLGYEEIRALIWPEEKNQEGGNE
jgi:tRNA(His) 5'-end guanylyltransferase